MVWLLSLPVYSFMAESVPNWMRLKCLTFLVSITNLLGLSVLSFLCLPRRIAPFASALAAADAANRRLGGAPRLPGPPMGASLSGGLGGAPPSGVVSRSSRAVAPGFETTSAPSHAITQAVPIGSSRSGLARSGSGLGGGGGGAGGGGARGREGSLLRAVDHAVAQTAAIHKEESEAPCSGFFPRRFSDLPRPPSCTSLSSQAGASATAGSAGSAGSMPSTAQPSAAPPAPPDLPAPSDLPGAAYCTPREGSLVPSSLLPKSSSSAVRPSSSHSGDAARPPTAAMPAPQSHRLPPLRLPAGGSSDGSSNSTHKPPEATEMASR